MTLPATNAPLQIITDAYIEAQVIQAVDTPNGEQVARGMRRLSDLIVFETIEAHLTLWLQADIAVPLVAGQATYNFMPGGDVNMTKPMRVLQGYYLNSSNIRAPLVVLSRDDYTRLSQTTQTGAVNSYFVDKQVDRLAVSFWLTPDANAATGTAHVILQQAVTQFTGLTDTMDFPLEWKLFLVWGLADELASGQPEATQTRCRQRAERYRMALEGWDVEDAPTQFTPDQRSIDSSGMFV